MGKKIKKVFGKVTQFDNILGTDFSGEREEAARREADMTRRQQEEQTRIQENLQRNMAADLRGDNLTNVIAGGSADAATPDAPSIKKRRPGGLSASLGV